MQTRAFAAIIAVGLCAKANATTIVAIWTPAKIVIVGDSMVNINWIENGAPRHRTSKDCKIRKFGSNYVSAAGNYHIQIAGFDVWQTAERACGTAANVELCAARFKADLRGILSRAITVHDVRITVLVAGLQNGKPAMEHITFTGSRDTRLNINSQSFREGKQNWGRVILGDREAIDRYERESASKATTSISEQALSLVKIEARAMPQEVGGPFSTLTIEAAGDHWINPGCCPASCSTMN
jgi:hypothetical protein